MERKRHTRDGWRRASSPQGSDCVEATPMGDTVAVRDSKHPNGPQLNVSSQAWTRFTTRIR